MDIHWERHTMDSLDTLLTKLPRLPLSAVAVTFTHSRMLLFALGGIYCRLENLAESTHRENVLRLSF